MTNQDTLKLSTFGGQYPKVHMMGIGGIGMSGIARLLLEKGVKVTGCDMARSHLTDELTALGAEIFTGHSPEHIKSDINLVVYSSAIKKDCPELILAEKSGIPVWKRAQMLAEISAGKRIIAVTGTHGKTTVSSMIAHILIQAGLCPSFVIGGLPRPTLLHSADILEQDSAGSSKQGVGLPLPVGRGTGNAKWGEGDYIVLEADESDGSLLYLNPVIAVITNIDHDHIEYYKKVEDVAGVMKKFADQLPQDGLLIGCGEEELVKEILDGVSLETIGYGFNPLEDIYAKNIILGEWQSQFDIVYEGKSVCTVCLNMPGKHNILNALAAVTVALKLKAPLETIKSALESYAGVKRRLDVILRNEEITIIDDYAHHPAEIKAVLDAVQQIKRGRMVGVFQPHRFTRTKFLYSSFAKSFGALDALVLTDIYSAGEPEIPGVTTKLIYDEMAKDKKPEVFYIGLEEIIGKISGIIKPNDTIIFMGAGSITDIAHKLASGLREKIFTSFLSNSRITNNQISITK